ncbi:MAG: oligosaccharide flippase family protein [Chloroflexi bacterium]|nr:oligosaccharide flippase family protein [Chloroflexota bacterium]
MHRSSSQPGRHMLDGTVRVLLAEALIVPTGLLAAAFLTRRLGPEGFGLFTLAVSLVSWIEATMPAVFGRATIKLVGEADDWRPVGGLVTRLHLLASVAIAILLWLLASPIATSLGEPALAPYLQLLAVEIPLLGLTAAHRHILIGVGGFRERALAVAARRVSRLLFIVVLVELGLSVSGAILGSIGATLVELAVSRYYVRPPLLRYAHFPARRLWSYVKPLLLFAVLRRAYDRLDLFALTALGGTAAQAGLYGAAQSLTGTPSSLVASSQPLLLATLSRLLSVGDSAAANQIARDAMRAIVLLLPFAAMTVGMASEVVALVFGDAFAAAAPLLAILIFRTLGMALLGVTASILTAAGRPGLTVALTAPMLPLAIGGHLLLIPWLGPIGAALVTTFGAGIGLLGGVLAVHRVLGVAPPAATLARSLAVCGLAYALTVAWPTPDLWVLVKLVLVGLAILVSFVLLGEFSRRELGALSSALGHRTRA